MSGATGKANHARRMRLVEADPNPHGGLDRLFLLAGDALSGPIDRIGPDASRRAIEAPGPSRRLRIFHFNDLHNFITLVGPDGSTTPIFAQIVHRVGAARHAAAADEVVLLVSAGDDHTGTIFDELLGSSEDDFEMDPAYVAYSAGGVDAAAIGNHDLDRGAVVLRAGIRAGARFPILSANLFGSRWLEPARDYFPAAIGIAKGLRIGFLGLTTQSDVRTGTAADPELAVGRPLEAVRNLLPALSALVDVVVVLSHCGHGEERSHAGGGGATRFLGEGDVSVARTVAALCTKPAVVVGGHTHTVLHADGLDPGAVVDGVPIVQAGGHGSHLGELIVDVSPGRRAPVALDARLHRLRHRAPLDAATAPAVPEHDAAFEASIVAPMAARLCDRLNEPIAEVAAETALSTETTLRQRYMGECALSNFVADALVAQAQGPSGEPVDIGLVIATAINRGLPPGGTITYGEWFSVMPFADTVQIARVSGRQLREIVRNNAPRVLREEELAGPPAIDVAGYVYRGFLHFSRRLRYVLRLAASAREASAEHITIDGTPLDAMLDRELIIAFNSYLGGGAFGECWNGSPIAGGVPGGIPSFDFRALATHDTGLVFRSEVVARIRRLGRIAAETGARVDGRMRFA